MTPVHANKNGVRYRYDVSRALAEGRAAEAGSVRRVPAPEIEQLVVDAVRNLRSKAIAGKADGLDLGGGDSDINRPSADEHPCGEGAEVGGDGAMENRASDAADDAIAELVSRVTITKGEVVIELVEGGA